MTARHWTWAGAILGFALGGFFDGILLHQILQWHHLLSLVPGIGDLRAQVMWDGVFHALMYVIAAAGLVALWRAHRRDPQVPRGIVAGAMLIGFGTWHVIDTLLSHWFLGIHRIRIDSPNPLAWDLLWLVVFGIVPLLLGLRLRRGGGGSARSGAFVATVALLTVGAGAWALMPPPGQDLTTVVFHPGAGPREVFAALDAILFYVFFEGMLIPMFIIIGVWGGKRRVYASFKFFLYTLLGSVLMLLAIMAMYWEAGTTDIPTLMGFDFPSTPIPVFGTTLLGGTQMLLFLAFFASFAVKMPMWPVHTWLPDAHVQAPTAASVLLAAVLLKMGGYGFLRFSLPMFPEASAIAQGPIFWLSAIAIVYTSLVALAQSDMKKLIAYSSVAHMGFVTLGTFAASEQGVQGAIFQMLSHGFISGALFLLVGVIYDRMHTREIAAYGGLVIRMPVFAMIFMLFTMGNVGLPGTSGFVGEFLSLAGVYQANSWVAFMAATGVIFSACYALWLYRRVVFGDLIKESLKSIKDMDRREKLIFSPLVIATIVLGVYPALVLDLIGPSVQALVDHTQTAQAAAATLVAQN